MLSNTEKQKIAKILSELSDISVPEHNSISDTVCDLKNKLENKKMTTIICPKQTCGCGLCAPKSMYNDRYKEVVTEHIDVGVLNDI